MASSSQIACASPPSSDPCWKYDVFLSFRGVDTRKGITVDIHDRLNRSGIKTFMDEQDLQVGDVISPTLLAAIKESRFAIVVLSQNYASSTWCLEELREICECMKDRNRILPLFYHVEPSDVRYQKKRSFEEAFSKHETSGRHELEKVKQWRDSLYKVANFSGWNTSDYKTHKELVDVIVEFLCSKVVPDAIESTGDFEAFKATREAMDEVIEALKDDEVTAIGVYGMGGVGKTTMVKHVGAHARKSGIFRLVITAIVSQSPDLEKIQGTLAELLGVELKEVTEIGRAARLSKEILRRNQILIILDDIWERMDLSKIGIPSYKELQKCNSKVLLTTRLRNVCHVMRCQRKIPLSILSKDDSWTLFARNAGRSFESTNFEDVARRVARECCGLPIALITVARALGDKDLVEWKRAVQRLEKSQTANPDDYGEASKCIKLSYDYLKDEDYKSYFLLCCLFPEDYEIEVEDLFRYAIGKGLFQDADTLQEARERADSVARHLKYSCLLLDTKRSWRERIKCVRMHDVVRDTAIQIVQSEHGFLVRAGCDLKDWPRQLHEGYSAISLMQNNICKLPEKLVCPELQILLLDSNLSMVEIPETFFQGPNKLTVLDLSNTGITLLPESFSLLINLQALCLDRCHNLDTYILGKLKKLEILSMRYCWVKKFSREMGNLINLRMLDITNAVIDTIPSKVISKFHKLEELYMQGFWNWGSKVEGEGQETNAGFDEVTSLSNLRVLKVCISKAERIPKYVAFKPNWVEFDIRIGRTDDRQRIFRPYGHKSFSKKLAIATISGLPNWFCNALMNTAEMLWWEGRQNFGDIFVEYELMNTIRVPKEPVFENLEELHLYFVNGLELPTHKLPPRSLFNLKLLEVKFCYNWGNVFLPSNLLLPNLEELNCRFTGGIEYVFGGYEALYQPKQSKLRKIELNYLTTIRSICHGPAPAAMVQALQSLTIRRCNFQGSLFTSDVAQCLSRLNYLELHDCPFLERIVEASNKKIILPKLRRLTLLVLPMLSYESATFECPSLVYLDLWGCPNFSASFSDFHSRETRTYY